MTPKPPPGFEIIAAEPQGIPPPPPGFEIVGAEPSARGFGIDWGGDEASVRKAVRALPKEAQDDALNQWADARVAKMGGVAAPLRTLTQWMPGGSYMDEVGGALYSALDSQVDYDEAVAVQRAMDRRAKTDMGWGGTAMGVGGALLTAPLLPFARGSTLTKDVGLGAAQGAGYGAVAGFGAGEGGVENRVETAGDGMAVGAVAGGTVTGLIRGVEAVAPAVGRATSQVKARLPQALTRADADTIANDVLAGRLQRAKSSPDVVEADLAGGQRSSQLGSNSQATLPEVMADTSDDLQRLTGSVHRSGGEASEITKPFLEGRQRGVANPYAPREVEGPQGQIERIIDDFDRALEVKSSKGARATAKELEAAQKTKADELYTKARDKSEAFDLSPVTTSWELVAQQYPESAFRNALSAALNLFRQPHGSFKHFPIDNIRRFDNSKKILDQMVDDSLGKDLKPTNLTRELARLRSDLLAKVHEGGKNKVYQQARDEFGTAAENREAIDLGRTAFKDDSEVTVDVFRSLTPAQQKLFRIGLRDGLRLKLATKKPGDDASRVLQERRIREILNEVLPASKSKKAEFADRPERFGDIMRREERMVQTRNSVLGNSKTAERLNDDAEFASDMLSKMVTGGRSFLNTGLEVAAKGLQEVFGYRRDVAAALARKLLDTNPQTRAATLNELRKASQPGQLRNFVNGMHKGMPAAGTMSAPAPNSPPPSPQAPSQIRGDAAQDRLGAPRTPEEITAWEQKTGRTYYPGVPSGQDGEPGPDSLELESMKAGAIKRTKDRSLLHYEDTQIVPNNLEDAGGMALEGLRRFGEVSAAFGPMGEALNAPLQAVGAAARMARGFRPQSAAEKSTALEARLEQAYKDIARDADLEKRGAHFANTLAQESKARHQKTHQQGFDTAARSNRSTGTVPDTATAAAEREATLRGLDGVGGKPLKGHQGLLSRDDQIKLVEKYFDKGGKVSDLGPSLPWGRHPTKDAHAAVEKMVGPGPKKTTTGPEANQPSVADLADAYQLAKLQAENLRAQIKETTAWAVDSSVDKRRLGFSEKSLREQLKQTQDDLIKLQQALKEAKGAVDDVSETPPRAPPKIFRRDE